MRPNAVVRVLLDTDHGLRFFKRVENLVLQALVFELAVENLTVDVFPWRARGNVLNLRASFGDLLALRLRNHLWYLVAADVLRDTVQTLGVGQRLDDTQAFDATCDLQRQTNPAVCVDQLQDLQATPVMGLALDEVEAPNLIAVKRPLPHAVT
jgi:hypothetical protein